MLKKPELMAPAGDMTSLTAAVENGADAVYLGMKNFSARGYANNFSLDELVEAVDYAHLKGVKVYVTLNVLVKDSELEDAVNLLYYLHDIGADAVILQDLGLITLSRKLVPELPVHASTQMTVHNLESVRFLEDMGVGRVILARELSLEELEYIKKNTVVGIETFVHGALCISYSGQCLFSSMIGGRSGNRGFCAQPCRKGYNLYKDGKKVETSGKYLLSPKDLNTAKILPELINTEIDAFKIEGRMKRPEYVAGVVSIYRKLIDRYIENPSDYYVTDDELKQLGQLFNRDFTTAYLLNKPVNLINSVRPYNRGLPVGKVIVYNCKRKTLQIKLSDTLNIGDGIGIEGEEDTGDTVTGIYKNGKKINSADSGSIVEIPFKYRVKSGSRVYKTFDKHLNESLEKTFTSSVPARKIPVSIIVKAFSGSNLELQISDGTNNVSVVSDYVVENALSKPTSKKQIEKQIAKMGNTVFDPSKITIHSDNNIFIPISQLNSIKNKAITRLEKKRIDKWKRPQKKGDESYRMYLNSDSITSRSSTPQIAVNVVSTKQLESAVSGGANLIYYEYLKYQSSEIINDDFEKLVETAHNSGCRIYLNTPRIITDNEMDDIKNSLSRAKINNFDGVLVSNPGFLRVAKSMGLPVVVNTPLNIFNKISFNFMLKCGAEKVVLSPELTIDQIKSVSSKGQAECIVHGPLEVMVSEYCFVGGIFGSKKSCGFPCRNSKYEIVDEKGYSFPLEMDENCRTHIYNSRDLCMLDNIDDILKSDVASIRINAGTYKPYDVEKLTKMYKKAVNDSTTSDTECTDILKGHTTGHYYRGVL